MATYPNGQWPRGELAVIPGGTKMGGSALIRRELLPSIVAMQSACYRDTGLVLRPTSAADGYRDLATQDRTFRDRYVIRASGDGPFSDVRYYQGQRWVRVSPKGSAAKPGTSNHGDAEAVDWADMVGRLLAWMRAHAGDYGWANPAWARDNNPRNGSQEPWHWEPEDVAFAVHKWVDMIGRPDLLNPGGKLPDRLTPEDDLDTNQAQQLARAAALLEEMHSRILGEGTEGLPHLHNRLTDMPRLVGDNVWYEERTGRLHTLPDGTVKTTISPLQDLANAASRSTETAAQLGALAAVVQSLATGQGLDPAALLDIADQGATRALERAELTVTVTTTPNGA